MKIIFCQIFIFLAVVMIEHCCPSVCDERTSLDLLGNNHRWDGYRYIDGMGTVTLMGWVPVNIDGMCTVTLMGCVPLH